MTLILYPVVSFCSCISSVVLYQEIEKKTSCSTMYVIELSVGFETKLNNSASRKFAKYRHFLSDLLSEYRQVKFLNLSISSFESLDNLAIRLFRCVTIYLLTQGTLTS